MTSESPGYDVTIEATNASVPSFAGGRYVVRRILPSGGQKRVYVVEDTSLGRECVISLIRPELVGEHDMERLRREAQAMARLGSHANVVTLFDFGEDEGSPYFVSEYITGGDARHEIESAGGPLAIERALELALGVAQALAHAHANGVIHRDVKPANILIDADGAPRLADFGLAFVAEGARLTMADSMLGTAAYMAPEQALGRDPDERSDLYALGATLYEMLTGRPPFIGNDALSVISQAVYTAPVAPSWHNEHVPAEVDSLVLRLLAKAPEDRAANATEVVSRLEACLRSPGTGTTSQSALPALGGLTWGSFVGRERELATMRGALENALTGHGRVVMLAGEPGIGKSRLAEEFIVYARLRGSTALIGRCHEGESALPFGPFTNALRQYVAERPDAELRAELGTGAPEVALLLPELRERFNDIPASEPLDGDAERFRMFDSVSRFLAAAAAARPVVMYLDDLHWSDVPSLLMFQYVARRTAGLPLLLMGSYRDTDLDRTHPLSRILAEFRREPAYERIALRGLNEEDVATMLTSLGPGETQFDRGRLAHALHDQTEGNPLFIREVLSHLVEEKRIYREDGAWKSQITDTLAFGIPEGLREVIGLRLSRLSDESNALLSTCSLMLGGVTWDEMRSVSGEPDARLIELLEEALGAQLLVERRQNRDVTYEFTHALIRTTLSEELSTPRKIVLHQRIGESLEQLYGDRNELQFARLAHHFSQAAGVGQTSRALSYSLKAAERSLTVLAFEDAADHYRRALDLYGLEPQVDEAERCDVLLRLGEAYARSGDNRRRRETFEQAAANARKRSDALQLAHAAIGMGYGEDDFVGEDEALLRLLQESLNVLPGDAPVLRAQVLARLTTASLTAADDTQVGPLSEQALEAARAAGDAKTLVAALNARHEAIHAPDRLDERVEIAREAVRLSGGSADRVAAWYSHDWLLTDLLEYGDLAGVEQQLSALSTIAEELRQPLWSALTLVAHTSLAILQGRFVEADEMIVQTAEAAAKCDAPSLAYYSQWQTFVLRREQGRVDEMEAFIQQWVPDSSNLGRYVRSAGVRAVEMNDRDAAQAVLARASEGRFSAFVFDNTWLYNLCVLAEISAFLRDAACAAELYSRLAPFESRLATGGDVVCLGPVARHLGLLSATVGDFEAAGRHFAAALEANGRMNARPGIARTQTDYGEMLRVTGDVPKSGELLSAARGSAMELGMTGLVARVDAVSA